MDRSYVYIIITINIIATVIYYIRKKCEVPLFLAIFNLLVEYRVISIRLGYSEFVSFNYGIDLKFNLDIAYIVSNLILIGSTVMIYCFMLFYKPVEQSKKINDSNSYLKQYILSNKFYIIIGLIVFTLIQIALRNASAGGYGFLIRMGNIGFTILLFLLFSFTDNAKPIAKIVYIGTFLFLANVSLSAELRFQFLGWIITIGYYLVRNIKPSVKLVFMVVGIFLVMIVFSLVRALQYQTEAAKDLSTSELFEIGLQRIIIADDINFIDGFIMLYQIYPKYLDYDYGFEHIEVFVRPIPRALWPDKPVGSWVRNYQKKYNGEVLESAGFSPTIWGVFYSEMGEVGVVVFSVFWAWFLSYIYRRLDSFKSNLSAILVGSMLASMIPLFRSGDMAGDIAIILMSFWPVIVFTRRYKKFVIKQLKKEALKTLAT